MLKESIKINISINIYFKNLIFDLNVSIVII